MSGPYRVEGDDVKQLCGVIAMTGYDEYGRQALTAALNAAYAAGQAGLEERLWTVIDRDGLADVPSDIVGAVARLSVLAGQAGGGDRIAALEKALEAIAALEPVPYEFPADWQQQIDACDECRRYKDHPIQQGICDTHRQPIWDREKHDSFERKALGFRAKTIAREALLPPQTSTRDGE